MNGTASKLGPTKMLVSARSLASLAKLIFYAPIHLCKFKKYHMMFSYVFFLCITLTNLLRTLSLLHVRDRSVFMAKTSSAGMSTLFSEPMTESSKDSLSTFDNVVTSYYSCATGDPLLMMSLTCSISVLRRLRVHREATLESTVGVVTLTRVIG